MPDLHTTPGGQNPDWHSDNMTGIPQFWHFRIFQEQIVKLWKAIAARYKEEPFLLGYDLLNEPFLMPKKEGLLNAFLEEVPFNKYDMIGIHFPHRRRHFFKERDRKSVV